MCRRSARAARGEEPGGDRRDPADRLDRQREIEAAAGAEEDGHPEEDALTLGGPHRAQSGAQGSRVLQHVGSGPGQGGVRSAAAGRLPPGDMLKARAFRSATDRSAIRRG